MTPHKASGQAIPASPVRSPERPERLSKATIAERALRLGDEAGAKAVTIRRLAHELGVTPMALYWYFTNKDDLLRGIVDYALSDVRAGRPAGDPWQKQLRTVTESLISVMRAHPSLPEILFSVRTENVPDVRDLLTDTGFGIEQSSWVSRYLLHGAIGMAQTGTYATPLDTEAFYAFGIDLLMSGVEGAAAAA